MTKVNAIKTNENSPYSVFNSLAKGTAMGAVAGYAAKIWLPVDSKEITAEDRIHFDVIREQAKRGKAIPIQAIRNLEEKTPAQDVFLKMVDNQAKQENAEKSVFKSIYNYIKKTDKFEKSEIKFDISEMRKIIREANLDDKGKEELRNIIAQVNKKSAEIAKRHINAQKKAIKMSRPSIAYITMGAVAGFFGGLIHKIISG